VHVAVFVHPLLDAIDPAVAERRVDPFLVRDATFARGLFVEADPEVGCVGVVLLQPRAKVRRRLEEFWLQGG